MEVSKRLNELFAGMSEEQETIAPDDLPKVKAEGALSEEDAKYLEFYRRTQENLEFYKKTQEDLLTTDNRDLIIQANMEDAIARATELLAATHQHEFTYHLNANHTALRGCKCGLAFVGLMAGTVQDLQWHQIHEVEE